MIDGGREARRICAAAPGVKYPKARSGAFSTRGFRSSGLGRELVARGLSYIDTKYRGAAVRIGAQSRLERFYNSFGFAVASEPYLEDGIPHIEMVRPAPRGALD
jgi:ElaA protein